MNKRKMCAINSLIWIMLSILCLFVLKKMVTAWVIIGLAGASCVCAILIHYRRGKDNPGYFLQILGVEKQEHRVYEYDWIRLIAVVMVILTHAIQTDISLGLVTGKYENYIMTIIYVICLVCNPLYVMLSASLLLSYREERISSFYIRRFIKVCIPMAVYFLIYMWGNMELVEVSKETFVQYFRNLYTGTTPESPHYWLIYIILSLYVLVPFLRYMMKDMKYKDLTWLVIIYGIISVIMEYVPVKPAITVLINPWIGVALAGYWITRKESIKYHRLVVLMGCVAMFATGFMIVNGDNCLERCCNSSIIAILMALGIIAFVFQLKVFKKGNVILNILSKYSYSIILAHWGILHFITRGILGIQIASWGYLGLLVSLLLTLLISLIAAIVIDNLFVVVIESFFEKLVEFLKKRMEQNNSF